MRTILALQSPKKRCTIYRVWQYSAETALGLENETVFRVRYARQYLEAHFYRRCQGVGLAGLLSMCSLSALQSFKTVTQMSRFDQNPAQNVTQETVRVRVQPYQHFKLAYHVFVIQVQVLFNQFC